MIEFETSIAEHIKRRHPERVLPLFEEAALLGAAVEKVLGAERYVACHSPFYDGWGG